MQMHESKSATTLSESDMHPEQMLPRHPSHSFQGGSLKLHMMHSRGAYAHEASFNRITNNVVNIGIVQFKDARLVGHRNCTTIRSTIHDESGGRTWASKSTNGEVRVIALATPFNLFFGP